MAGRIQWYLPLSYQAVGSGRCRRKRRLLFVSATRARDLLYITSQSVAFGDKDNRTYNRFLVESFHVLGKEFSGNNPYDKTIKSA